MNLKQGKMSVKVYALKFLQLSRYAPELVSRQRSKMRKFSSGCLVTWYWSLKWQCWKMIWTSLYLWLICSRLMIKEETCKDCREPE